MWITLQGNTVQRDTAAVLVDNLCITCEEGLTKGDRV